MIRWPEPDGYVALGCPECGRVMTVDDDSPVADEVHYCACDGGLFGIGDSMAKMPNKTAMVPVEIRHPATFAQASEAHVRRGH